MESDQCSVWTCVLSLLELKKGRACFFDELQIQWNVHPTGYYR